MTRSDSARNVEAFAKALDAEDYIGARELVSDSCVYEIRGTLIKGGDAVIASYRENGEAGRKRFDNVFYESSVSLLGQDRARIDYTDIVNHEGGTHIHRCAQEVDFDESGKIVRVVHIDLPGEAEALEAFKESRPGESICKQDAGAFGMT
jgi:hypothetical protein